MINEQNKKNRLLIAQELAKSKNGICLSKEYNKKEKLLWCCDKQHIWKASFDNIVYNNTWCPICAGKLSQEEFLEEAKKLAKSKGGECLSFEYINAKKTLEWKCSNDHIWKACLDNVKNNGTWCPQCAGRFLKNEGLEKAKQFALNKGGECLSTEYSNRAIKLKWKCGNNHIWMAVYHNVVNHDRWCPKCAAYYYKEHIIRDLIEYFLNSEFKKAKPKWNINPKTNNLLEFDGYNENLNIAFEFQGLHHYKTGVFHATKDDLEYVKYKDEIKKKNCVNNNIKLIIIEDKYAISKRIEIAQYILGLLNNLNINIVNPFNVEVINKIFHKITNFQKKYLEEAKKLAKSRGGECLSTEYIDSKINLLWKCDIVEHKPWSTRLAHVRNGSWCPICANAKTAEKLRDKNGLKKAQEYAKSRGGRCLSTNYINCSTKMEWQCSNPKHKSWFTNLDTIIRGQTWCPNCHERKNIL